MSKASTTRTIKFITKSGTYTAMLTCSAGDLWQEYKENASTGRTEYIPDYASMADADKPVLTLACTGSRVAEALVVPTDVAFYFNGTRIYFNPSTGAVLGPAAFADAFELTNAAPYVKLKFLKNPAALSGNAPVVIMAEATIATGTQTDTLQVSYTIPVTKYSDSAYRVTIGAGDTKNFIISEEGGSCIITAHAYQGGSVIDPLRLTYKWYKLQASGWVQIAGQTSQSLTVNADDIDSYGDYMVEVYLAGSLIGQDAQGVLDATDPLDIEPNPVPADEAISEGDTSATVTYTPALVSRRERAQVGTGTLFSFIVRDAHGNILNAGYGGAIPPPAASYAVTHAMCVQGNGDVTIVITSND